MKTEDLKKIYENVGMPRNQYFMLLGAAIGAGAALVIITLLIPFFQGVIGYVFYIAAVFLPVVVIIFPYIRWQKNRSQIEGIMHLLITKLGILSTAEMPRKDIIKMIADVKDYGALAEEFKKIWALMEFWNYDLPSAARYISARTPSPILADFLSRMAYSIDAGEAFEEFIFKEQEVVMQKYSAKYDADLSKMDLVKELWASLTVSFIFFTVFSFFVPLFVQMDSVFILSLSLLIFAASEASILLYVVSSMPKDDLWHKLKRRPAVEEKIKKTILACVGVGVVLAIVAYMLTGIIQIVMVAAVTPLLFAMQLIKKAEKEIEECDDHFESFMRAVAVILSTVGGTLLQSIEDLRNQRFGALTKHIDKLYKRLYTRIDIGKSWEYFAADTGSNQIAQFSGMYVEGVLTGGDTIKISKLVSNNLVTMRILRKKRAEKTSSMNGIIYALCITSIFTIFLGINVMEMLNGVFDIMAPQEGFEIPIYIGKLNIEFANLIGLMVVVVHAITSGTIIKVMSGRHMYSVVPYMAGLVITGALVSYLTDIVVSGMGLMVA